MQGAWAKRARGENRGQENQKREAARRRNRHGAGGDGETGLSGERKRREIGQRHAAKVASGKQAGADRAPPKGEEAEDREVGSIAGGGPHPPARHRPAPSTPPPK